MRVPSDGAQATSDDLAVPQTLLASGGGGGAASIRRAAVGGTGGGNGAGLGGVTRREMFNHYKREGHE